MIGSSVHCSTSEAARFPKGVTGVIRSTEWTWDPPDPETWVYRPKKAFKLGNWQLLCKRNHLCTGTSEAYEFRRDLLGQSASLITLSNSRMATSVRSPSISLPARAVAERPLLLPLRLDPEVVPAVYMVFGLPKD